MKKILFIMWCISFPAIHSIQAQEKSLAFQFNAAGLFKNDITLLETYYRTPAIQEAEKSQTGKYESDIWEKVELKAGDTITQGKPGSSNFFSICKTLRDAGYQKEVYWKKLQVEKNSQHGYRTQVALYVINKPITAAIAKTLNNKKFGTGGAWQFYISNPEQGKLTFIRNETLH